MTGQERRTRAHLPSPSQAPHLRKATQDDAVGWDPVPHLMFNQSLDWGGGYDRVKETAGGLKGAGGHCLVLGGGGGVDVGGLGPYCSLRPS